jgi:hypothetical protein
LRLQRLLRANPHRIDILPRIDDENTMKMLAKIGYCFCVLHFDGRFEPQVLEYILSPRGDNFLGAYYVGQTYIGPNSRKIEMMTDRRHCVNTFMATVGKTEYAVTRIWLFNKHRMPIYDVVCGPLR